jgi:Skp family chaperone for outer membrane proteins
VKTIRFFVPALGMLVGLAATHVSAQNRPVAQPASQPVRQAAAPQIAVIDISRVFKEHPRFIDEMARLKTRVEAEDSKMKLRADRLQATAEELKGLKSGSQEYKDREKYVASERAQMQIDIQVQRKEFLQQEAAIYKQIYEGIKLEVASYASRAGLAAVVRVTSPPPESDPEQPSNVLTEIQKDLVWFHPQLDITNQILANLKARSGPSTVSRTQNGIPPYSPQGAPAPGYRR